MNRTRIHLGVFVDLDPVPGAFHTADDARNRVANILGKAIPWYKPHVSIESYNTSVPNPNLSYPEEIYILWDYDADSWDSRRMFKSVHRTLEGAVAAVAPELRKLERPPTTPDRDVKDYVYAYITKGTIS